MLADYFTNYAYKNLLEPSKPRKPLYNLPGCGRRPLSQTCPSSITNNKGDMVIVVGCPDGMRIPLSIAWITLYYILLFLLYFFTVLLLLKYSVFAGKFCSLKKLYFNILEKIKNSR